MRRFAITLAEVVSVLAVMSLLVGLALPAVQMAREASRETDCSNHERQIILGLLHFQSANNSFPSAFGHRLTYWQSRIVSFVGEQSLADEIDLGFGKVRYPVFHPLARSKVDIFQCGSNPDQGRLIMSDFGYFGFSDYCGVSGIAANRGVGVFPSGLAERLRGTRPGDIVDGLSNTLCFGERPPSPAGPGYGRWLTGQNILSATIGVYEDYDYLVLTRTEGMEDCLPVHTGFQAGSRGSTFDWLHHWSFHPAGVNFAYADGSVRMLTYSISPEVLKALSTRADGDPVVGL